MFRCLRSLQQYLKWRLIRKGLESKIDSWMHAHLFLFLWFHFFERDLACYRTSLDLLGRAGRVHRFVKNTFLCGFSVLLLFNSALPRFFEIWFTRAFIWFLLRHDWWSPVGYGGKIWLVAIRKNDEDGKRYLCCPLVQANTYFSARAHCSPYIPLCGEKYTLGDYRRDVHARYVHASDVMWMIFLRKGCTR